MRIGTPPPALIERVAREAAHEPSPALLELRDAVLSRHGDSVQAILYYGSCLRGGDPFDGLVDLYVLVDRYRHAFRSRLSALGNAWLAPNVYYLEASVGGRTVRAKYAVVSLRDFESGTSPRWFHSYLWARFAQPTGKLYLRAPAIEARIDRALAQAVLSFVARVVPRLSETFTATELWHRGLSLTYRAELRAEKTHRTAQLVEHNRDSFEARLSTALPALPYPVHLSDQSTYRAELNSSSRLWSRLAWALRIVQGKLLSLLRLIKALFTFQGGIEYVAWKLERHSGQRIELTPRLRRYPLIFVWPLMWRLYRRGVFR
jgi:hypothetical protein